MHRELASTAADAERRGRALAADRHWLDYVDDVMKGFARTMVVFAVSAGALVLVALAVDVRAALATAATLPASSLGAALGLLAAGLVVAGVRYRMVLAALGLTVPWGLAMRANLVGIVGGMVFLNFIGQTLARAAVLGHHGIGGPAVLLANVYERLGALASLVALALAASLYLFGGVTVDLLGGGKDLLKLALVGTLVAAVVLAALDPRLLAPLLRSVSRTAALVGLARVVASSVALHGTTLAAFVVLGHAVAPQIPLLDLAAASLIVMLAASLPISFAGWGVREISAVHALGAVGMDQSAALAVSVLVGVSSLLLIALAAPAALLMAPHARAVDAADVPQATRIHGVRSRALGHLLGLALPLMAGALVLFQIHVPVAGGKLNLNLADPVAIAGGLLFLARYAQLPGRAAIWRIAGVELLLAGMTIVLAAAFLNGVARFGVTDWALTNRLVGWLVLLGYLGTGALALATAGPLGLRWLLRTILVAALAVAAIDIALLAATVGGLPMGPLTSGPQLTGMAQNANAFVVQMALALAIVGALPAEAVRVHGGARRRGLVLTPGFRISAVALLLVAIFYVRSRTGYGVAPLALAAMVWLGMFRVGETMKAILLAMAGIGLVTAIGSVLPQLWLALASADGGSGGSLAQQLTLRITHDASDGERWMTIRRGLEMWLANPLTGAGLGAFVHEISAATGVPLVIHNTPVWLLAETGIVGFAVVGAGCVALLLAGWRQRHDASPAGRLLLMVLLIMGLAGMVHEVLYQRLFLLLLGATLVAHRFRALEVGQVRLA